jgi:hypothetical protein
MYPHERSLVEKYADQPFAIVGVNSDDDLAELAKVREKERITWRSFWNGPQGTQGPISKAWNVRGWPTLYVIDAAGRDPLQVGRRERGCARRDARELARADRAAGRSGEVVVRAGAAPQKRGDRGAGSWRNARPRAR